MALLILITTLSFSFINIAESLSDQPKSWQQIKDTECLVIFKEFNISYNLCPLQLSASSQIPYISMYDAQLKKSFAFNVFSDIVNPPSDCSVASPAFLFDEEECISFESLSSAALFIDDNPSEGVIISYQSTADTSAICPEGKMLNIRFRCSDRNDANFKSLPNTIISEIDSNQCQYNLTLSSIYGCPSECPLTNKKVCNDEGLCGFDPTKWSSARCYCYSAWQGFGCEKLAEQTSTITPVTDYTYNLESDYTHQFTVTKTVSETETHSVNVTFDLDVFFEDILSIKDLNGDNMFNYFIGGVPDQYSSICNAKQDARVFKVDTEQNKCNTVGGSDLKWNLYDSSNAAKGVTLAFGSGATDGLCSFTINFICPIDRKIYYKPNRNVETFVFKDSLKSECSYYTNIVSAYVCPKECISEEEDDDGISVCSLLGVCLADYWSSSVRCQCDGAPQLVYNDAQCVVETESGKKTTYVVTVIVILLLVIIAVIISIMFYQRQKKQISQLLDDVDIMMDAVDNAHNTNKDTEKLTTNTTNIN